MIIVLTEKETDTIVASSNTNRALPEVPSLAPDASDGEGNEALTEFLEEIKDHNAEVVAPTGEEQPESGSEAAPTDSRSEANEEPQPSAAKRLRSKKTGTNG